MRIARSFAVLLVPVAMALHVVRASAQDPFEYTPSDAEAILFAGENDRLSEAELVEYLLVRGSVTYGQLRPPFGFHGDIEARKRAVLAKVLGKLAKGLGQIPAEGYLANTVQDFLDSQARPAPILGIDAPGITSAVVTSEGEGKARSRGPVYLRATPQDLGARKKAKGATLQFVDNKLDGGGSQWTTQGSLVYPFVWEWNRTGGLSEELKLGPALSWRVIEGATQEIDDLQVAVPIWWGQNHGGDAWIDRTEISLMPYAHTDWSLDGWTVGATLTAEPVSKLGPLTVGDYHALIEGEKLGEILAYRLQVMPKVDYSNVLDAGGHTTRDASHDWLRAGGKIGLGLRFFGNRSPLEMEASYEHLAGIGGGAEDARYFLASITQWLYEDQVGLTLKYEDGETPVSQKDIDQLTLGLDLRF